MRIAGETHRGWSGPLAMGDRLGLDLVNDFRDTPLLWGRVTAIQAASLLLARRYSVSGAMSAPFGHAIPPPSRKKRAKYSGSLGGSKIGPVSHSEKSIVF